MQHPLAKSPISAREIGDFVACEQVIEWGFRPPIHTFPLLYSNSARSFCSALVSMRET